MTYAPIPLLTLRTALRSWTGLGLASLGIVGDAAHQTRASYHNGRDVIVSHHRTAATDYSIRTARDQAGLSNAASAMDIGSFAKLRDMSSWLVREGRANAPGTSDIREIIYSPDGQTVLRWDRERGASSAPRPGEADNTHLWHTHVSWYRDSEARDKVALFRRYFDPSPVGDGMAQLSIDEITDGSTIDILPGAKRFNLDGTYDGFTFTDAFTRSSPYRVNDMRAFYAMIDGKRVLRLVKPATFHPAVGPLPTPMSYSVVVAGKYVGDVELP